MYVLEYHLYHLRPFGQDEARVARSGSKDTPLLQKAFGLAVESMEEEEKKTQADVKTLLTNTDGDKDLGNQAQVNKSTNHTRNATNGTKEQLSIVNMTSTGTDPQIHQQRQPERQDKDQRQVQQHAWTWAPPERAVVNVDQHRLLVFLFLSSFCFPELINSVGFLLK